MVYFYGFTVYKFKISSSFYEAFAFFHVLFMVLGGFFLVELSRIIFFEYNVFVSALLAVLPSRPKNFAYFLRASTASIPCKPSDLLTENSALFYELIAKNTSENFRFVISFAFLRTL
jgi:hypothetical protein